MLIVKIRSEENKRKILENKRKLKGGSIWRTYRLKKRR